MSEAVLFAVLTFSAMAAGDYISNPWARSAVLAFIVMAANLLGNYEGAQL